MAIAISLGSLFVSSSLLGAEFRLTNGDHYTGTAANFDDLGLTLNIEGLGFSSRIGWSKLTQETLRDLARNPRAFSYVEPFIDPTPEELERARAREKKIIVLKDVDRVENPADEGFIATVSTPAGIALAIVFFLANLYAAYEIAIFRQRPIALVCGLSFILPGIGPIIFLSLPASEEGFELAHPGTAPAPPQAETLDANPLAPSPSPGTGSASGGLGISKGTKTAGSAQGGLEGSVFTRGDTTFNRRFFETKFAGFFRVVPGEAEKDLVLVIRAAKNEHVAKRISRINASEMYLQTHRGGGAEVMVSFGEVIEVRVRNKDAKS